MHSQTGLLILLFIVFSLLIGAGARQLLRNTRIPYTVGLLVIGLLLGGIERTGFFGDQLPVVSEILKLISNIDPQLILFVFLPTLIFESAFALEVHLFKRIFSQIAILAVPGLVFCTLVTAALAYWFFPWEWSWPVALMFGALISATDPVAVVALLKEVSSRKRLETLIEGESLLNDGTAIVFFTLFYSMAIASTEPGFAIGTVIGDFSWVVSLGLIIGVILGYLAIVWIGKVFNDPMIEISVTIAVAYLVFYVAEALFHASGIVAVVALALMFASVGRTRISPEVSGFLHHFWEMMAHIANTLIFLLVGILIATRLALHMEDLWLTLALLYVGLQIIRAASVMLFMPVLKRIGIGITREKAMVLVWGGLRGAVSLALALTVAQETQFSRELGDQILFLCAGIVVLTIVINGMTMETLLQWLQLNRLPVAKQLTVDRAKMTVYQTLGAYMLKLKGSQFLQAVDWQQLEDREELKQKSQQVPVQQAVSQEDINVAYRRRLLETERRSYWNQFTQGTLSSEATQKLVKAVEQALDEEPEISPRGGLQQHWRTPPMLRYVSKVPQLKKLAINLSFDQMAVGYDIARGFISAQEELLKFVEPLAPSKKEAKIVRNEVLQNKRDGWRYIEQLQEGFSEVVAALESRSAHRLLLNKERSVIAELLDKGVLDTPEAERMRENVEKKMFQLSRLPTAQTPPDHRALLEHAQWMQGVLPETVEQLCSLASTVIYGSQELLIEQGERQSPVILVIRGSVERLQDDQVTDVLGPGSLLGLGALFTSRSGSSVRANGPVHGLVLPLNRLKPIVARDTQLSENLRGLLAQQEVAAS